MATIFYLAALSGALGGAIGIGSKYGLGFFGVLLNTAKRKQSLKLAIVTKGQKNESSGIKCKERDRQFKI